MLTYTKCNICGEITIDTEVSLLHHLEKKHSIINNDMYMNDSDFVSMYFDNSHTKEYKIKFIERYVDYMNFRLNDLFSMTEEQINEKFKEAVSTAEDIEVYIDSKLY